MGTLVEDAAISAEWISRELQSLGYVADFSPESLREVDRFFDENFRDGTPVRRFRFKFAKLIDPTGRAFGFAFGTYVGEVFRRALGGQWMADDSDPHSVVSIELLLPTGEAITPVMQFVRRAVGAGAASFVGYAQRLGLDVGPGTEHR